MTEEADDGTAPEEQPGQVLKDAAEAGVLETQLNTRRRGTFHRLTRFVRLVELIERSRTAVLDEKHSVGVDAAPRLEQREKAIERAQRFSPFAALRRGCASQIQPLQLLTTSRLSR